MVESFHPTRGAGHAHCHRDARSTHGCPVAPHRRQRHLAPCPSIMKFFPMRTESPNPPPQGSTPWLAILTAVYACVGLSPLFAFRFALATDETWAPGDILGLLSFIVWLLILFLGVKTV